MVTLCSRSIFYSRGRGSPKTAGKSKEGWNYKLLMAWEAVRKGNNTWSFPGTEFDIFFHYRPTAVYANWMSSHQKIHFAYVYFLIQDLAQNHASIMLPPLFETFQDLSHKFKFLIIILGPEIRQSELSQPTCSLHCFFLIKEQLLWTTLIFSN